MEDDLLEIFWSADDNDVNVNVNVIHNQPLEVWKSSNIGGIHKRSLCSVVERVIVM